MNIALTVRGALEEDAALQEIVSILYRKASEARGEIEAGAPRAGGGEGAPNAFASTPKPGEAAVSADLGEEPAEPEPKPEPKPEPAKAPTAPGADFATVAAAARKAMNEGKRDGFAALLKARGAATLAEVPEADLPALLAEIEAL